MCWRTPRLWFLLNCVYFFAFSCPFPVLFCPFYPFYILFRLFTSFPPFFILFYPFSTFFYSFRLLCSALFRYLIFPFHILFILFHSFYILRPCYNIYSFSLSSLYSPLYFLYSLPLFRCSDYSSDVSISL